MTPTKEQINAFRARASLDGEEIPYNMLQLMYLVTREINRLRVLHGLPQYTASDVVTAWRAIDLQDEPTI